jgi:hypothetical protein
MFAELLGARPMRGSSDSLLPADGEGGSTSSASASYLSGGGGGGGGTSDENVAAAAAAAVAAGLHHGFMASPQEVSCSNSMQMRTPMTGAEGQAVLALAALAGPLAASQPTEPGPASAAAGLLLLLVMLCEMLLLACCCLLVMLCEMLLLICCCCS